MTLARYRGFSTTLTDGSDTAVHDVTLIKSDLLNNFNVRLGELPGRSGFGSVLRDLMAEPFDDLTKDLIASEVRRIITNDVRITMTSFKLTFGSDNHSVTAVVDAKVKESGESVTLTIDSNINRVDIS